MAAGTVREEGGSRALRSQGPASLPRLGEKQFAQLEAELAKGLAAHGWEDQRWTLNRVNTVIGRRFHLTYTVQGIRKLLLRMAGPARPRPDGRSSRTTRRWPDGSRRCGPARKARGGE